MKNINKKTIMTSITITTFFAVLVSLSFGNQDAYAQSYPDFSDLAGLQLNGDAAQVGDDLRVTPSASGQAGSAFFDTTVDIGQFQTQFEFVFDNFGGIVNGLTGDFGADGMVFTIQNDAAMDSALGGIGGELGYSGISPSVGVSFDSWPNNWGNPAEALENISILQNGDHVAFLNRADFDFDEGQHYFAWIDYDGTTLDVFIATSNAKPGATILSQAIDIPEVLGTSDGYVGFTSATASAFADHDILSWNYHGPFDERVCNDDTGLEESICKSVIIEDESGDGIIYIGEKVTYFFVIDAVNTSSETWTNVHVADNFGGDLAVGDVGIDLTDWEHEQLDVFDFVNNLTCDLEQTGKKTFNEHLLCWVSGDGDLSPAETASVGVTAETDWNHGQSKKYIRTEGAQGTREYTSCGQHSPNSGATISYFLENEDPDNDEPHVLYTPAITVDVFQNDDLSLSDCDGDEVSDDVDQCPFRGLEETGFIDEFGCPIVPV